MRLAGSSGANPFACIAAGIACLWGPAHGGANEAALNMLREIGTPDRIPHYIERAKDKDDPFRLMGFGHRVYKNYDPRATVMQQTVREVFKANNMIARAAGNPFAARSISPLHAMSRRFYYRYESDLQNLGAMGHLHAERARAVARQDEKRALANVTALMEQIENYTRRIFEVSVGSRS